MKAPALSLTVAAFLSCTVFAAAQADTAHHRAVYQDINTRQSTLRKVTATHSDEPTLFALTGWLDGHEVKKIVARCGDDGDGVTEYYLDGEKPLFVFNTYYQNAEGGKRGTRVEERLYFKEGVIFKWLTTEKPAPIFHGEDYQATTELYTSNCAAFVAALKKAKSGD